MLQYSSMQRALEKILSRRGPEATERILSAARQLAESGTSFSIMSLQRTLRIGYDDAVAVHDWLVDQHAADPTLSNHIIRCGRRFVMNNPFPTLEGLAMALDIGDRRAYAIMLELERRNIIRIGLGFRLERVKRMSAWADLVRQLEWVAKKYKGRCEPELLQRILYLDMFTAVRLAQYGEEHLGLTWKNCPRELR